MCHVTDILVREKKCVLIGFGKNNLYQNVRGSRDKKKPPKILNQKIVYRRHVTEKKRNKNRKIHRYVRCRTPNQTRTKEFELVLRTWGDIVCIRLCVRGYPWKMPVHDVAIERGEICFPGKTSRLLFRS